MTTRFEIGIMDTVDNRDTQIVIPRPDSGILKRLYANLLGSEGAISLDIPDKALKRLYTYESLKIPTTALSTRSKTGYRTLNSPTSRNSKPTARKSTLTTYRWRPQTTRPPGSARSKNDPIPFSVGRTVVIIVEGFELPIGDHEIYTEFIAEPFGELSLKINDTIRDEGQIASVPRDEAIAERHEWLEEKTRVELEHVSEYSFEAERGEGNVENFIGVAQMSLDIAGPVKVNGEHANGEYPIPLATTEGILVASYSRRMKAINMAGGAKTMVTDDRMNRALVFVFEDARKARDFRDWVFEHQETVEKRPKRVRA